VDLFLVLLLHASFSGERSRPLALALFFGLLMDVGLPVKGSYYPLIYLGIALLALLLRQNLNLHTRRYQALLLGFCTLLEGGGIWMILWLQGAEFAETRYVLQILAGRIMVTVLAGPLLLAGLERLDRWFDTFNNLQESQEA
jgi:cell shape-determining protein MreD